MGTAQACPSLHFSKYYTLEITFAAQLVFIYITKKPDNLDQELKCILKIKEDLS